jgi:serine/threonine protein phosphatase PrpC
MTDSISYLFTLQTSAAEHQGSRRFQEDSYLLCNDIDTHIVAALADGLGGHHDGLVASEVAVREAVIGLRADIAEHGLQGSRQFREIFLNADRGIDRIPWDPIRDGFHPASTLVLGLIRRSGEVDVAGLGDSLCWAIRDNQVHELLLPQGSGNCVAHCLGDDTGSPPGAAVQTAKWQMRAGDQLVIASDGLLSLSRREVVDALAAAKYFPATDLVKAVLAKGEPHQDNCSVILVKAVGVEK